MSSTLSGSPITIRNYINGAWVQSNSTTTLEVHNPSEGTLLGLVPTGTRADVDNAVAGAVKACEGWRRTPPEDRIQYLFKLKQLLEDQFENLARVITIENGKTLAESRGELRRAIENVEVACGIPILMQGYNLEDVASGIDEIMIRQPLGVVAAITPFNFPAMIPFWFLPYAIACGNAFILKPSERVPLTMTHTFELIEKLNLPPGVLTLLNGSKEVVNGLIQHPDVRAISFVGSTQVARYVYAEAAKQGKRVQCQGGAKNHVLVLPDADMESTSRIIGESAFGCAGQRCLAVSVAITVDAAKREFTDRISGIVGSMKVGNGLDQGVQMGPLITTDSKQRVEKLIEKATSEGATPLSCQLDKSLKGTFVAPTILKDVKPESALADTEIFGPVLSVIHAKSIDEGIKILSRASFGNAASIFTSSGAAARKFRYEVPTGNIGVNIGVAAPMAYFPFSGWKESFFGVVHAQGRDAIEFYTDKKVVVERWPKEWTRTF
jgi:malonate-semialdehyde dehydrogenase (acetylating) / methylmalonate-semialdehyde dehydrogenase